MNQSKVYRSIAVKAVDVERVLCGREGSCVEAGVDIGKKWVWVVIRFRDGTYLRPWRVSNPQELSLLSGVLKQMSQRVKLTVAMESSGTYGDALRAALSRAGLIVHRVSSKASHDWAESFDGVPSQHDGKDAGVVAELCAMGKSVAWPMRCLSELEQEMAYWVDQLDGSHRVQQVWVGRLESRLARHWPEACGELKVNSPTLLKALKRWGSPASLGADPEAASTLARLSRGKLDETRIDRLVDSARKSMGLAMSRWDERRMREDAEHALSAHRQKRAASGRLRRLAGEHELLPALGKVVGVPTACVLWVCLGDPRQYDSGAAYRKAMGLNLAERSSGMQQGQLHISKRGKSLPRRFLYFAAMRYVCRDPRAKQWYAQKKRRDEDGLRGLVAVMRKLPLALWSTAQGEAFDAKRLFQSIAKS